MLVLFFLICALMLLSHILETVGRGYDFYDEKVLILCCIFIIFIVMIVVAYFWLPMSLVRVIGNG